MPKPIALTLILVILLAACRPATPTPALSDVEGPAQTDTPTPTVPPTPAVPPGAVAWLQVNAVPFEALDLGSGCDDLVPLLEVVGEARIVGLGEATHGTREFYLFKARLVECLVIEEGFNLLAMEAGWSEANALDTVLQTGAGDPAERLAPLAGWVYNTEEVLGLMDWIRQYNQVPGASPVRLLGLDMQYVDAQVEELLAYVAAAGPSDLAATRADLECFLQNGHNPAAEPNAPLYSQVDPAVRERCLTGLLAVHNRLAGKQQAYEAASSPQAFARALRTSVMLLEAEELFAEPVTGNQIALRDRFMAENAAWLLEQAGPGAKMILWGHNGHVDAAGQVWTGEEARLLGVPPGTAYAPLGARLRATYGEDYQAVGFAFGRGSFNAFGLNTATGAMTGLQAFTIEAPFPGSFEAVFTQADLPQFYLDLGRAAADPEVGAWFSVPGRVTLFGAGYITNDPLSNTAEMVLPESYAILVYLDMTTPSRLR